MKHFIDCSKINACVFSNDWTLLDVVHPARWWSVVELSHLLGAGKMSRVVVEESSVHQQLLRKRCVVHVPIMVSCRWVALVLSVWSHHHKRVSLIADTQLFILAPLMIYPLWKCKKTGLHILAIAAAASVIVPFYITYTQKLDPTFIAWPRYDNCRL